MAVERWEALRLHGQPRVITGRLLSALGWDGWQVIGTHTEEHLNSNTMQTVLLIRRVVSAYERSRQTWVEYINAMPEHEVGNGWLRAD